MGVFGSVLLLATDGSLEARRAGRMAVDLSDKLGMALHVVNVAPAQGAYAAEGMLTMTDLVDPDLKGRLRESAERESQQVLDEQAERLAEAGGKAAETHARIGRPDAEIVRLAEELDAGLLVLGSRGSGPFKRAAMGSVAESVTRNAHCPVLVARAQADGDRHRGQR